MTKERALFLAKRVIIAIVFCTAGLVVIAEGATELAARGRTYETVVDVPAKKVALLLGTSKYAPGGSPNLFYRYRVEATADLYNAGKIQAVLISGDNGTVTYSEPEDMRDDLVMKGIPTERIFLDYAGFRIWDSIVRAKEVFQESDFIIVSQKFHNKRALLIAWANGIEAIAFNARDVPVAVSPRVWIRERLARVKGLFDIVVQPEPHFSGDPEPIVL